MEVFSLISLLLGLAGGICAIVVQAAQTWSSTMGTVLSSSVQTRPTGRSHSTFPVVVYQYEVNGKTYQSQTIKAGDQFMNIRVIGEAQATVARYPIGASVMVYYNPENPAESALER